EVKGELHASGTLANPDIEGWVNVRNAEVYVPAIDLTSERTDADILFDNGRVIVDRLDANIGTGSIEGRGDYTLFTEPYPFFFGLRVNDVIFSPDRHISAVCSGNLTLEGTYITPLMIDGKMTLKEALVTYGLGDEIRVISPAAPLRDPSLPPPPPTYLNLTIKGEKNIWIRNNDMDIEVIPDLEIIVRDDPMPQIVGELRVKRGSAYYLDHQFRLDPARSRIIFPPIEELDPEFDIWASMRTSELDSSRGKPEVIEITLHMAGTLTEPILEFYSDPPVWSESEIISYLHLNLATAFVQGVVRDVTSPIQNWARLDVFSIEDFAMQDVPTKVTFGKYISDKLFASYTVAISQRVPGENQHQFRVEYDVGRNQDIILERDEEGAHNLRYQIKLRY
ncbi:MAG: translocation/assembly module TamB domain-containing protein, partial [candidate division WOR-3 bacterium]|nr:translocation/assembly module TamB domain-containing protein [candidate division WOR-3 bacterium]